MNNTILYTLLIIMNNILTVSPVKEWVCRCTRLIENNNKVEKVMSFFDK